MSIAIRLAAGLVASAVLASSASAHVTLLSPNGGEVLIAGGQFQIHWEVYIAHDLENWDLSYRTEPGPNWIQIIDDYEAGDPTVGSQHYYTWDIPNIIDDSVWVRVIMDNVGAVDYQDVSLEPFSIVPTPGSVAPFAFGLTLAGLRRRR